MREQIEMPRALSDSCEIVAEIGVNHDGSLVKAKRLIEAAQKSGATAVKFQVFSAEELVGKSSAKAPYQLRQDGAGSQLEMLKRLELPSDLLRELKDFSDDAGIKFLASGFSIKDLREIMAMETSELKIPSGEINNFPLLRFAAKNWRRLVISTGASTLDEVRRAVSFLREHGPEQLDLTVLQCTSAYPAHVQDTNLLSMVSMKNELELPVGFSDHTRSIGLPAVAVALGAIFIEKHFTLDRASAGPDHSASLEPSEFSQMVSLIREAEAALGSPIKAPSNEEAENAKFFRKSIVVTRDICEGEIFSEENLGLRRPASGIPADQWFEIIGLQASRNYRAGEQLWL